MPAMFNDMTMIITELELLKHETAKYISLLIYMDFTGIKEE